MDLWLWYETDSEVYSWGCIFQVVKERLLKIVSLNWDFKEKILITSY